MNIKKEPMQHRGIRFSSKQWKDVEAYANEDETGKTKASDVVRHAVDVFLNPPDQDQRA